MSAMEAAKLTTVRMAARHALAAMCFIGLAAACSREPQSQSAAPAPAPDTVYFNGDILTMNDNLPNVEAVAVNDGKISWVGDVADIESARGDTTRWVDLQRRTLMPGFFDSHSHLTLTAAKLATVNVDPPCTSESKTILSPF